jgi:hypothetical protein
MTHMISRLRCAQETMLVRLTARCQGGSIDAPIVELIRDGIGRLAGTRRLTAHAAQPSAPTFAAPGLFRCRQPQPAASPARPTRRTDRRGESCPARAAVSGSNYRRERGPRGNHADTQPTLLWGRGPEAFGPRWREAAQATGWPRQRAQAPPRRSLQRRLSLGEQSETSTQFRSPKFRLTKTIRPCPDRRSDGAHSPRRVTSLMHSGI